MKHKKYRKHIQHTKKFIVETNSVKNVVKELNAFRTFDEVWLIGKYKGIRLDDTPVNYIKWCIENVNMSSTLLSILKNKL